MEGLWPILAQTPMIRSMTGFARRERQFPWGSLAWELKTVNHRFLEVGFRLPEEFRVGEAEFLGQAKPHFQKTMIDRLQFPSQRPPGKLALASRKAGHATNHRGLR